MLQVLVIWQMLMVRVRLQLVLLLMLWEPFLQKKLKQLPKMLLLLVVPHKQPHKMQQQLVQRQLRLIPMLLLLVD